MNNPAYESAPAPPPSYYEAEATAGHGKHEPPPTWGVNPPPPPGWSPYPPSYGAVVVEQPTVTQVILVGGCPACRVGVLEEDFSCLGVLCAIVFFPLGILCCLALRDKRCTNCGARF